MSKVLEHWIKNEMASLIVNDIVFHGFETELLSTSIHTLVK